MDTQDKLATEAQISRIGAAASERVANWLLLASLLRGNPSRGSVLDAADELEAMARQMMGE